ncbi:MAG: serine/threonine protein kinase [Pseudomonadota bacterium]
MANETEPHPYDALTPDTICRAIESLDMTPDGRLLALNSYENRVYQVGIEDAEPVVAKFYRPQRWPDAAIAEEHAFAAELAGADIPVVAPLPFGGQTLHTVDGFRFAVYPRRGGHWPELDEPERLKEIGRLVARLHNVGELARFQHRPTLDVESFGREPVDTVIDAQVLPDHLFDAYESVADDLIDAVDATLEQYPHVRHFRLHGDLHPSNVLDRDDALFLVDLDDARNGPAIQDLWMFLAGNRDERSAALEALLEGYATFREFDASELALIEAYRALRMVHYAAWLTSRYSDPAFQRAFPWFAEARYWEEHVLALREQRAALDEPALAWLA